MVAHSAHFHRVTRSGEPIGRGLHASRPRIRNREFVAQLLVVYDYRGEDTGNDGCIMHAGRGWGEFLQRSASFIPSWAVLYKTVCCVGGDLLHEPIRVDIWIVIVARGAFDGLSEAQSGLRHTSSPHEKCLRASLILCHFSAGMSFGDFPPSSCLSSERDQEP